MGTDTKLLTNENRLNFDWPTIDPLFKMKRTKKIVISEANIPEFVDRFIKQKEKMEKLEKRRSILKSIEKNIAIEKNTAIITKMEERPTKKPKKIENITDISKDSMHIIFSFLNVKEFLSLSMVSKEYYHISKEEECFNKETIEILLREPLRIISNLKVQRIAFERMKDKIDEEIQKIDSQKLFKRIKESGKSAKFIHDITQWKFRRAEGKFTQITITFDWKRGEKKVSFSFKYCDNILENDNTINIEGFIVNVNFKNGTEERNFILLEHDHIDFDLDV